MASKLKLTELLYPTSTTPAITINADDTVTFGAPTTTITNLSATSITDSGNLTFTGTGNRIRGDFSTATIANRVAFQTSTVNSNTNIFAIPNGTAAASGWNALNNSDPTNASYIRILANSSSYTSLESGIFGTGTYLPMAFFTGGSEAMRINTVRNVGIGTSGNTTSRVDVSAATNNYAATFYANTGSGVTAGLNSYGLAIGGNVSGGSAEVNLIYGSSGGGLAFNRFNGTTINESARLDSSGNLLVGTQSALVGSSRRGISVLAPTGNFVAASFANDGGGSAQTMDVWNKATSGNNFFIAFYTETSLTERGSIGYNRAGGLTAYNTTSDRRAKDILGDVTNSGEIIDALKVYSGMMKGATVARPMLIADEAQEITPYAVTGEKDAVDEDGNPVYQQIDVSSYVPLLIAELQSLRKRVAELESI